MKRKSLAFLIPFVLAGARAYAVTDSTLRVVAVSGSPAVDVLGTVYTSFDLPVLDNLGRVAFQGRLSGPIPSTDDKAIWYERSPNDLGLVLQSGNHLTPTEAHLVFSRPLVNDAGEVVFLGATRLDPFGRVDQKDLLLQKPSGEFIRVARDGQPMPGEPPGVLFDGLALAQLNESGDVAFVARRSTDNPSFASRSLWLSRPGVPLITFPSTFEERQISVGSYELNGAGQIAFAGNLSKASIDEPILQANWLTNSTGQLKLIARQNDPAPGSGPAGSFEFVSRPHLSDSGHVSFFARIEGPSITPANDSGLWIKPSEQPSFLAVRESSLIPGSSDEVFGGFNPGGEAYFSADNKLAFTNALVDAASIPRQSVWSYELDGPLSLVAREGGPAPGLPAGSVFGSQFSHLTVNSRGQIAFEAAFQGTSNGYGIWAQDPTGTLQLIAHTGQIMNVGLAPNERTIMSLAFADRGRESRTSGFNDVGELAYWARLDEGLEAVLVSSAATIPETGGFDPAVIALITTVLWTRVSSRF
jgi:hypothetical protein